jgi:predicted nucleic acid-binding protein
MNIVDSCGWLEYLANGPNSGFFEEVLRDTNKLLVPTITVFEVTKRLLQQGREDAASKAVAGMQYGTIVELDLATAAMAAKLACELGLSLADSIILATARMRNATLWTQDAHFKGIEGVRLIGK